MRALIGGNTRPYDVSLDQATRDVFKEFRFTNLDLWDWDLAGVPMMLTKEEKEHQELKNLEKRKKQREKEKKRAKEKKEIIQEPTEPIQDLTRRVNIVKLNKTELSSVGMTPEARARLDREKRYFILI